MNQAVAVQIPKDDLGALQSAISALAAEEASLRSQANAITGAGAVAGAQWNGASRGRYDDEQVQLLARLQRAADDDRIVGEALKDYADAVEKAKSQADETSAAISQAIEGYGSEAQRNLEAIKEELNRKLREMQSDAVAASESLRNLDLMGAASHLVEGMRDTADAAKAGISLLGPAIANLDGWAAPALMSMHLPIPIGPVHFPTLGEIKAGLEQVKDFFVTAFASGFAAIKRWANAAVNGFISALEAAERFVVSSIEKAQQGLKAAWDWALRKAADVRDALARIAISAYDFTKTQVVPRIVAGARGWLTLAENKFGVTQLILRSLLQGQLPNTTEIIAAMGILGGSYAGLVANIWDGRDHGWMRMGRPDAGEPTPTKAISGYGLDYETPHDLDSLTRQTMSVYDDEGIRVDKVVGADGKVRYIVMVPGTQGELDKLDEGWANNENAREWHANLDIMVRKGHATNVEATEMAIDKAMRALGEDGSNGRPEILLTGHSQGGIISSYLASDLVFRTKYKVDGVIDYAGPGECADFLPAPFQAANPPVLKVMNGSPLNHGDIVPRLDLGGDVPGPFPDRYRGNFTEVTLNPVSDWGPDRGMKGYFENHEPLRYVENIDKYRDQNEGQRAAMESFLDRNGLRDKYLATPPLQNASPVPHDSVRVTTHGR